MNALRFAWLQLARDPLTTGVATLALAIALAGCMLVVQVGEASLSRGSDLDTPFDVVIGPKTNGLSLVLDALELRAPPEDVIPFGMFESMHEHFPGVFVTSLHVVTRWNQTWVLATDDTWVERPETLAPPTLVEGSWLRTDSDIVLGSAAAARLGLAVGDAIAFGGAPSQAHVDAALARDPSRTFTRAFDPLDRAFDEVTDAPLWRAGGRVVGILHHGHAPFDDAIFVHRTIGEMKHRIGYDEGIARRVSENGATTFLYLKAPDPSMLPAIRTAVHRNSTTMYAEVDEEMAALTAIANDARAGIRAVAALITFSVLLGIGVLFNLRFDGLRPRIALLRSLGYPRGWLVRVLALEGVLLVGAGWCLAVGAVLAFSALGSLPSSEAAHSGWLTLPAPDPRVLAGVLGAGLAATALALIVPWIRLARARDASSLQALG